MKLKDKRVLIFGYGKSGHSASKLLLKHGAVVFGYDKMSRDCPDGVIACKSFSKVPVLSLDFCVINPAVDLREKEVKKLKDCGVKIMSELELGALMTRAKLVGITGTNGKTTCTKLLNSIFQKAGYKSLACGNVGVPITEVCEEKCSHLVVEVSSFQLETMSASRFYASALLNIEPDHLNRHLTFPNYARLKQKLLNMSKKICINTSALKTVCVSELKKPTFFSTEVKAHGTYVHGNVVYFKKKPIMLVNEIKLLGKKNLENVLACVTLAKLCGVKNKVIRQAVSQFEPLEHRLEPVFEKNGVLYINDSKATNVASTLCALEAFEPKNTILLLGGRDKGLDFTPLKEFGIKQTIVFGEASQKLCEIFENSLVCTTLKEASLLAVSLAKAGDVVLLSPACASYDEFKDYEDRGKAFKRYIKEALL